MCGRFTLTVHHLGEVAEQIEAWLDPIYETHYRARYNVAPTDAHWIVRDKNARREIIPANWGLINHWEKKKSAGAKHINARAETLATKPAYREAYRARRCVVPADGFYEWRGPKNAREPVWYHAPDRSLLWLAGLYEGWTDPATGELMKTFTIVTTAANELVAPVHDRMPAVLRKPDVGVWLGADEAAARALLVPAPAGALIGTAASPRVNSAAEDDSGLLDAADPRVPRQLKLL
jgi:putative SOS response-associated peptidase YedK